jgi:serine/threonine-protein kinase
VELTGPYQPGTTVSPPASPDFDQSGGFPPGQVLAGRYRIVALLGKGGMGIVYRADDLKLGQSVALKFPPESLARNPERLARFHHEVRIARQVSHPNVCRVYDLGEHEGRIYLSMEFIDGQDLAGLLRQVGHLPEDRGIEIARHLCLGLAAAHDRGVLHRDLKPHNVMIDGRGQVRLTDFGLAAMAGEVADVRSGTPGYMAPEQLAGTTVSAQSDLFSLGLILYELFTGKRAFPAKGPDELRRLHDEAAPSKPSSHVGGLNPAVERVILRCLEKEPARRPKSAYEVLAALPGGDPLAAALAAGQTPSPQMVADAPVEGSLSPVVGLTLLAATLLGIVAVGFLNDKTKLFRRVPLHDRPEVFAHQARDMLQRLGYRERPADSAQGFDHDFMVLEYLRKRDASPARWDALATGQPAAIYFWYRQSPDNLTQGLSPASPFINVIPGVVTPTEPPLDVPGMVSLLLDLKGRLIEFRAVPPSRAPEDDAPAVDWQPLFRGAGLDQTAFREAVPRYHPPVFADRRAAWAGVYPDRPEIAIRVEAAACHGKVVFFRIEPEDGEELVGAAGFRRTGVDPVGALWFALFNLPALTAGAWLAWRNWRLGRANGPGALRLAGFLFTAFLLSWLFLAHHSFSFNEEFFGLLAPALGRAILQAGLVWLMNLALEPYVRRR